MDQLIQAMASFSQQTGLTWGQGIAQQPQQVQNHPGSQLAVVQKLLAS